MNYNKTNVLKYSVIALNAILCFGGAIMLIAGSIVESQIHKSKLSVNVNGYTTESGAIISIIAGLIVLLMGVFGIYSAYKDQVKYLYLYSGVMAVVLIVQLVTGSVGLSARRSPRFEGNVANVFAKDLSLNSTQISKRDFHQQFFKCCGWNGPVDYVVFGSQLIAPTSCCKVVQNCNVNDVNSLNDVPCKDKIVNYLVQIIDIVCIIMIIFAVFILISIIFSILLARHLKSL